MELTARSGAHGVGRVNSARNSSSERRRLSSVDTKDFALLIGSAINPFPVKSIRHVPVKALPGAPFIVQRQPKQCQDRHHRSCRCRSPSLQLNTDRTRRGPDQDTLPEDGVALLNGLAGQTLDIRGHPLDGPLSPSKEPKA